MKRILIIITASYLITLCGASSQTGATGLSFLKNGVGARAQAMGDASAAVFTDPSALWYNPANIAMSENTLIHFTHKSWLKDMSTDYIGAVLPWKRLKFGLSINSTSVNDIELRTVPGDPEGYFSARNVAIGYTAAYSLTSDAGVGVTAKYLYEKIYVDEASGFALDAGMYYKTPWNVMLGFSVSNLGSMTALKDEKSGLPVVIRAGAGYKYPWKTADGVLSLSADLVSFPKEETFHLHAGTELQIKDVIAFRVGYMSGYETRSVTAGLGINYRFLSLGYAYVPFKYNFQSSHTLSLDIAIK